MFWRSEITKQAMAEVKQNTADLEDYVEVMRKGGLTYTFGLVRAMVSAVLKHGGCEPAEMVASLRELADERRAQRPERGTTCGERR